MCYYACDLVDNPKELEAILESYVTARRTKAKRTRLCIFLDEITSVKGWQKAIKFAVDKGVLDDASVIVTGSHTLDLRVSAEQLPGRRGKPTPTPDLILLPMKFAEYVELLNPQLGNLLKSLDLLKVERRHKAIISLSNGKVPDEVEKLALETKQANVALDSYLRARVFKTEEDQFQRPVFQSCATCLGNRKGSI